MNKKINELVAREMKLRELEYVISVLDTLYENGDECIHPRTNEIVLDTEYDTLKSELYKIDPNSKIFKTVTASQNEIVEKKVKHSPPMTSISKCNGTDEEKEQILNKWMDDYYKNFPNKTDIDFCMSYKRDGCAISIYYSDGILKLAGLRSRNGIEGTDVTEKVKYIKNIPKALPFPVTLTIRGEIETYKKDFEIICQELENSGEEVPSNPRAYTAGKMGKKYAEEIKDARLSFTAYSVLNLNNPPYKTEIERSKWVEEKLGIKFVKLIPFSKEDLELFEKNYKNLNYMVDGCVISVNNLENQEQWGNTGNSINANPRGKIAWKFCDMIAQITVKNIIWSTGRTGNITPVLNFDGVKLEGTTVKKCTAHNWGNIKNNKIGPGSEINIIKSGKIIPKIKSIIEAKGKVEYPLTCPSCGFPTEEKEGNDNALSLICKNKNCPAQNIGNLNHYLNTINCKGISDSTINKLVDSGLVNEIADFYKLELPYLLEAGFKERTAILILARIAMFPSPEQEKDNNILLEYIIRSKIKDNKINIKIENFIASLGIDGAGKEFGRILAENYSDIYTILELTAEQLLNHEGIGPITSKNIYEYFQNNKQKIKNILKYINLEFSKKEGKLLGKTFCLSGTLESGKDRWKQIIENNGGIVKSGVNKNLDYLLAGEGSGLKTEQAKKYNVKIITEKDIENMI